MWHKRTIDHSKDELGLVYLSGRLVGRGAYAFRSCRSNPVLQQDPTIGKNPWFGEPMRDFRPQRRSSIVLAGVATDLDQ